MSYKSETKYSSPNYTPKSKVKAVFGHAREITSITIHHWGVKGQSHDGVVAYLCRKNGTTSAHYVVSAGRVTCIVDPDDASWAAGSSIGNATSIHVECRPEATSADYATVSELVADLKAAYPKAKVLWPHSHWKATACPGDWNLTTIGRLVATVQGKKSTVTKAKVVKKVIKAAKAVLPKKSTYVTLPRAAGTWGVYKLGTSPVAKNIFARLNPGQLGNLTYKVVGWTVPGQVAIINTKDFGQVQIYVAEGTGAVFSTK